MIEIYIDYNGHNEFLGLFEPGMILELIDVVKCIKFKHGVGDVFEFDSVFFLIGTPKITLQIQLVTISSPGG